MAIRYRLTAIALLLGLASATPTSAAETGLTEIDSQRLSAYLDAGEFAPALEAARSAAAAPRRDEYLAQIAAAQAAAGAREASLRTAAEIGDGSARSRSLDAASRSPLGGRAGGGMADFDSLTDLITTTVSPDTWEDVGGAGGMSPFYTGVLADPEAALARLALLDDPALAALRTSSRQAVSGGDADAAASLRKISLTRLERQVELRLARRLPATEEMQVLAGLRQIRYLFVYPESGDIVIAGPAGRWQWTGSGSAVSADTGAAVLRLDDLVVMLRHVLASRSARFGCAITPRQAGLARLQAFVAETNRRPLPPGQRGPWLQQLRQRLGPQDVEVYGLDRETRAAAVLVAADYHMKLVGMGLERGTAGVVSYLDLVRRSGGDPPPMTVLRWWFTMNYDGVAASPSRDAFALLGNGVKVLSENELLAAEGKRVHTGQSDELNRRFAESFTEQFPALAAKYPIYGELRNLFDLALVATLIREEDLPARLDCKLACFGPGGRYETDRVGPPAELASVVNYRALEEGLLVAGVSGGVAADPARLASRAAVRTVANTAVAVRTEPPRALPAEQWWWD